MTNPYESPGVQDVDDEKNVKGGFYATSEAKAVECLGAWISMNKSYLRVKYLSRKSRNLVLIIFCIAVVLLIPFAALGGLGAIILYAIINTIVRSSKASKIEFSLVDERLLVDSKRRIIGIRKIQDGDPILLGTKVPQLILDQIVANYDYTEEPIKKGSRFVYQLIALSVWLWGLIAGVMIQTQLG